MITFSILLSLTNRIEAPSELSMITKIFTPLLYVEGFDHFKILGFIA